MDRIRENLYITNAPTARDISEDNEFDEVVTLGYLDSFGYDRPSVSTTGDQFVFPDGEHDYQDFKAAVDYILENLENDNKVLVHCQAGVSRSGGVCATVLSEWEDISVSYALEIVQDARSMVDPVDEIRESMGRYTGDSIPSSNSYD
jgi:protein-tyrosine phosphatase